MKLLIIIVLTMVDNVHATLVKPTIELKNIIYIYF